MALVPDPCVPANRTESAAADGEGDSGTNSEDINPMELAEPTTSEEEGDSGDGVDMDDSSDDAGEPWQLAHINFRVTNCRRVGLMFPHASLVDWQASSCNEAATTDIAGSGGGDDSSGDEGMGDFASADLWAERIDAVERGEGAAGAHHGLIS